MNFSSDPDFKTGAITGILLHLLMIWSRIELLPLKCIGGDCQSITTWDIPASVLYYAFDDTKLILASFVIGSIYWGFLFWWLLKGIKYFFGQRPRYRR